MFAYLWAVLVYGIGFGVVTNKVIKNKGYKENWFWWGCLFGVFALIVACTKPSKVAVAGVAQTPAVDSSIVITSFALIAYPRSTGEPFTEIFALSPYSPFVTRLFPFTV